MMRTFKVPALASAFTLSAVVLFGCPIYSSSQDTVYCTPDGVCCDESQDNCTVWTCGTSAECPNGAYCNSQSVCSGGNGGGNYDAGTTAEAQAGDGGDCSTNGCDPGFTCTLSGGAAVCLASPEAGVPEAGVGDANNDQTVSDAPSGDAQDAPSLPPFTGCTTDSACTADSGPGARCLDGKCVAAANQCSDSTQCPTVGNSTEACVQGVCTPTCAGAQSCPSGYTCSTDGTAVCTGNPTPCGSADGGLACASGTTCVDQHCVPLCSQGASGDGAATCASGLVCVDNGCIPDQAPKFLCQTDGQQDTCASGSICLHHNCYIACNLDGGSGDGGTCQHADAFNVCKAVQTSNGTYDVCGSNSNLGNQCDLTQGKLCSSPAICIDGYCR